MGDPVPNRAVVLGQGAAGLTAALTVAREGIPVVCLSKTRPGAATCTLYAGGGFTLGLGGMTPEQHRELTLKTGRFLSRDDLLDVFCRRAPGIVSLLQSIDLGFRTRDGGLSVERDPCYPLLGGKKLLDHLKIACTSAGVQFLSNMVAVRILEDEKGVSGVECVDYETGRVEALRARAVVLATGGGGGIYERTDNPQRITGDGYRLAFLAGCTLSDMEFVQFYPIGIDIPGGAHWFIDLSIMDLARVTNSRGEEFLKEKLANEGIHTGREANLLARDKCTVWISLASRDGPVLLHLEDVDRDAWNEDPYLRMIARMFPVSSPPWSGPVQVNPIQHYFPGGVVIGTSGQTELPGLFAAGEVTAGVDGANRVGGNALTSCLVFGTVAGASAAAYLKGSFRPASEEPGQAFSPIWSLEAPGERSGSEWMASWQNGRVSPEELRRELRSLASRYLLPVRDEEGLKECVEHLDRIRERLSLQRAYRSRDLLQAFENLGLWYTTSFVCLAALTRRESRGAHFRIDHPLEREEWRRNVVIRRRTGSAVTALS